MKQALIVLLAFMVVISFPVMADVDSEIRKLNRDCLRQHRDFERTLESIDGRLKRIERMLRNQ